ncbi:polysaccharide deacetylase family protein [Phreatobacter sp. HK31-P]
MAENDTQGAPRPRFPTPRRADSLAQADDGADMRFGSLPARLDHMIGRRWPFRTARVALQKPVVSISFDDFPVSAYTHGAPILEDRGVRGTYYVASGLSGLTTPHWIVAGDAETVDLHRRGHEIGLHGHCHRAASSMRPAAFAADLAANRARLRRLLPDLRRETYAYPYGLCGLMQKRHLAATVRASRSVQEGINAGRMDLDFVKSVEISERALNADSLDRLLDQVEAACGWLVFFTHDVCDTPSAYGTSIAMLTRVVERTQERGIDILPVGAALDRIGVS